jgi:O-antigen ligase
MIALRTLGHSIEVAGIFARIDSNMRVGGTVGSPSNAAAFLQMILVVALSLLLTKLNSLSKLLSLIAFIFGIIALILTFTRGGWIGFFASITIFLFIASIRGWISFYYFALIALITISLSIFFYDMIVYRFLADDFGSAHSRIPLMNLALKMISENPIFGVGSNNFAVMIKEYTERGFGSAWLYVVHNKYLLVWSETGIAGLASFLWFLSAILYRGWQCTKLNDQILSRLALGFTMAVVGNMVHMMVDIFNSRSDMQLFWLFAGIITVMYNLSENEKLEDCGEQWP